MLRACEIPEWGMRKPSVKPHTRYRRSVAPHQCRKSESLQLFIGAVIFVTLIRTGGATGGTSGGGTLLPQEAQKCLNKQIFLLYTSPGRNSYSRTLLGFCYESFVTCFRTHESYISIRGFHFPVMKDMY